jgi:hypothetical protein
MSGSSSPKTCKRGQVTQVDREDLPSSEHGDDGDALGSIVNFVEDLVAKFGDDVKSFPS